MDEGNLIIENEPERRKLSRTHNWYSKRSKPVRFILIIVMLALLILILEGLLLFGLWIESLKGGLAVFVQPENTKVEIPLLGSSEVSFDISVQNLPLCKAICDWEIKRQDTNEIMSYGRDEILSGTTNTLTVNIEAGTQRKEFPIILSASCQNELARHCRKNSESSIGRTITIVTFEDTIESGIAREYLEGEGRLRLTQRQELLADLNAILELKTILIPTVKTMARQQADIIKESLEEVRIAYDNDNPIRARAILEPKLNYSAYEEYMNAVRLETDTINKLRNASSNFDRIGSVGRVANEQDRDSIIALTSTIRLLSQRTNTTDIFLINKQIEQAERLIREMINK